MKRDKGFHILIFASSIGIISAFASPVLNVPAVDNSTYRGKTMFGYQGWFSHPDAPEPGNFWRHWGTLDTTAIEALTVDMYPDLREYGSDEKFPTAYTLPNGEPAPVFSSVHPRTVERHMKWVRDYNIDGVFQQRFLSDIGGAGRPRQYCSPAPISYGVRQYADESKRKPEPVHRLEAYTLLGIFHRCRIRAGRDTYRPSAPLSQWYPRFPSDAINFQAQVLPDAKTNPDSRTWFSHDRSNCRRRVHLKPVTQKLKLSRWTRRKSAYGTLYLFSCCSLSFISKWMKGDPSSRFPSTDAGISPQSIQRSIFS